MKDNRDFYSYTGSDNSNNSYHMYSSGSGLKIRNKGNKKDSRSVSVTENEQDIVAESEMLELVKEDALKESKCRG